MRPARAGIFHETLHNRLSLDILLNLPTKLARFIRVTRRDRRRLERRYCWDGRHSRCHVPQEQARELSSRWTWRLSAERR